MVLKWMRSGIIMYFVSQMCLCVQIFGRIEYKEALIQKGQKEFFVDDTIEKAEPYLDFLQKFLQDNQIQTVVELGCGDWKILSQIDWRNIRYTGFDLVPQIIKKNQEQYGNKEITFIKADFNRIDLPSADLLLCKDVFQYMSNKEILKTVKSFKKYKYCLILNEVDSISLTSDNLDVKNGSFHTVDLSKPPFNLSGRKLLTYCFENEIKQVFLIKNIQKI